MSVTEAQVQDMQTTVLAELKTGTFTIYGETPQIHLDTDKKSSKNAWLSLTNTTGKIIYTVNNSPLLFDDTCGLTIHMLNRSDADKVYADVINIFSESSKNITITRTRDGSLRGKYVKILKIKLLDI
jgi:hypothetical protein